jgi:subtilisin family serine protease
LGPTAGSQTLVAAAGTLGSITFTALAAPGAPASVTVANGDGQTGEVAAALANPISVLVRDQDGNPVPDVTVEFSVASNGGQVTPPSAKTNLQGIAAATWVLGPAAGPQTASARVGSLPAVAFSATARSQRAANITVVSGDNQTVEMGSQTPQPLVVRVTDAYGNPVAGVAISFALASGTGTLAANTGTTDASGLASTRVTPTAVGSLTVQATSTAIPNARALFSVSTGNSIVGQVTVRQSSTTPLALKLQSAARSMPAAVSSGKSGSMQPAPRQWDPAIARSRMRSRGRLVVSYRPESFGLPAAANSYLAANVRTNAVSAYRAAMAPLVQSGLVVERALSPAIGAYLVEVAPGQDPDSVAAILRRDPRVSAVEEDQIVFAAPHAVASMPLAPPATEMYGNDPYLPYQLWHYRMIDAHRAWPVSTGSQAVRVAILDTGIRPDHPALAGLVSMTESFDFTDGITPAFSFSQPICGGGSFITFRGTAAELALPRNMPQDPLQVYIASSSATCWSRDPVGSHGIGGTGVNWRANLIAVRVLGITGGGWNFDVAQGILYAGGLPATYTGAPIGFTVSMPPAHVTNMSLGGSLSTVVRNAIQAASANTLIIASAGNSATSTPSYPAGYPEPIAVVALDPTFGLANYTNVGVHVDIAAPGGDFRLGSTAAITSSTWNYQTGVPNYALYQGTSMAAPHVTGVAALIKARNPGFTPADIRNRLLASAVDLGPPGPDDRFGYGVVNAFRAVTGASAPSTRTQVRLVDGSGDPVRSLFTQADGRFVVTNIPSGNYFLAAAQDEADDGLFGFPGRRVGWWGGPGRPMELPLWSNAIREIGVDLSTPLEQEPNDLASQAQRLFVNSWVMGYLAAGDPADVFRVDIPVTGTYVFETSGVLGACGFGLELDTVLELYDGGGSLLGSNDDTTYPTASYPGQYCSLVARQLQRGTYYIHVKGFLAGTGWYVLHVRSGS